MRGRVATGTITPGPITGPFSLYFSLGLSSFQPHRIGTDWPGRWVWRSGGWSGGWRSLLRHSSTDQIPGDQQCSARDSPTFPRWYKSLHTLFTLSSSQDSPASEVTEVVSAWEGTEPDSEDMEEDCWGYPSSRGGISSTEEASEVVSEVVSEVTAVSVEDFWGEKTELWMSLAPKLLRRKTQKFKYSNIFQFNFSFYLFKMFDLNFILFGLF